MKRIIMGMLVLAVLAMTAGTAKADRNGSETCGGNNPTGHGVFSPSVHYYSIQFDWTIKWWENCGSNATISTEIQYSSDYLHWTDAAGSQATFMVVNGNTDEQRTHTYHVLDIVPCGSNYFFRVHVWANANAGHYPDAKNDLPAADYSCPNPCNPCLKGKTPTSVSASPADVPEIETLLYYSKLGRNQ